MEIKEWKLEMHRMILAITGLEYYTLHDLITLCTKDIRTKNNRDFVAELIMLLSNKGTIDFRSIHLSERTGVTRQRAYQNRESLKTKLEDILLDHIEPVLAKSLNKHLILPSILKQIKEGTILFWMLESLKYGPDEKIDDVSREGADYLIDFIHDLNLFEAPKTEFFGLTVQLVKQKLHHLVSEVDIIISDNDQNYDDHGCVAYFKSANTISTGKSIGTIGIPRDVDIIINNSHTVAVFTPFLESIDVDVDKRSIFVLTLLHEMGHARALQMFLDADMVGEYAAIRHQSESFAYFAESKIQDDWEHEYPVTSFTRPIEAEANMFAVSHFMTIWKEVKHIVI